MVGWRSAEHDQSAPGAAQTGDYSLWLRAESSYMTAYTHANTTTVTATVHIYLGRPPGVCQRIP